MGRGRSTLGVGAMAAAGLLLLSAMAFPWWAVARESGGDVEDDERYAPFRRPDGSGDDFQVQVLVLGVVATAATVLHLFSAAIALHSTRASAKAGGRAAWQIASLLAATAALAYVFWAFPAEANAARGRSDLTFLGRECSRVLSVEICIVTRPLLGFWLAAGATGCTLASLVLLGVPRRDASPRAPPRAPALDPPRAAAASARPAPVVLGGRSTRVVKCPQCQTKMGFTLGQAIDRECPNCGRRVRG